VQKFDVPVHDLQVKLQSRHLLLDKYLVVLQVRQLKELVEHVKQVLSQKSQVLIPPIILT